MDVETAWFDPAEASWRARVRDYPTVPRGTEEVETLLSSVETLLSQLPGAGDSELMRLRAQALNALAAAKAAVAGNVVRASEGANPLARTYVDAYVGRWPLTALTAAGMLGLAVGLCVTSLRHWGQPRSKP